MTDIHITSDGELPFHLAERRVGTASVVTLSGSCSMIAAPALGDRLIEVAESDAKLVVLDLTVLEFIESTSLGKIVAAYLKLRRRGADMRIVGPQDNIVHLLNLTRLSQLFTVFPTVADALKADSGS